MSDFLFLYGTLLPEMAPPEIAAAAAQLRPAGEGFVRGHLYHLGEFPGAVLDPQSEDFIFGSIFELPAGSAALRAFDAYEEFDPADPRQSLFLRTRASITLAAGGQCECWIYVYNREVRDAPRIESGRWEPRAW